MPNWFLTLLYHYTFPPARYDFCTSLPTLVNVCLLDYNHSNGYEVVFICIFLMVNSVEHLSKCLLAIYISSGKNVFSDVMPIFQFRHLSFCCWGVRMFYISGYKSFLRHQIYMISKYFLSFQRLYFLLCWWCSLKLNGFKFGWTPIYFLFCCLCFWCSASE